MVETVADVMSFHNAGVALRKSANALIPIMYQIAHKQQHQFQLQQDLLFLDPLVSQLNTFF